MATVDTSHVAGESVAHRIKIVNHTGTSVDSYVSGSAVAAKSFARGVRAGLAHGRKPLTVQVYRLDEDNTEHLLDPEGW